MSLKTIKQYIILYYIILYYIIATHCFHQALLYKILTKLQSLKSETNAEVPAGANPTGFKRGLIVWKLMRKCPYFSLDLLPQ